MLNTGNWKLKSPGWRKELKSIWRDLTRIIFWNSLSKKIRQHFPM